MIWERGKSRVLNNVFVSLIESKLHLNLSESAMYTAHLVSISPNAVILYDHLSQLRNQSGCTGLHYPLEMDKVVWFVRTHDPGAFNFMNVFSKGGRL